MSPASRSKSKEKAAARAAAKEQQKASSKPSSAPPNTGTGIPASAYNPVSGTFHTLETATIVSSPPPQNNGRFRNIDETDEHSGSSLGTGAEYDSVSNNDSCSGESEDHKEKTASTAPRQEAIPGCDNDKRDKIRQKNERKHQRQKERRAQELHERCSGYLMSRKLEALAQQLVAMGFNAERSTMALILNEGRVEDSITWLVEGGEEEEGEQQDPSLHSGGNLKLDISEELARIADLEKEYKCTKQEVERAVVSSEGDLQKAAETLRSQKLEPASAPSKPEESLDPLAANGSKLAAVTASQSALRTQVKALTSIPVQQRTDEKDFNYTKAAASASPESGNRGHPLRKIQSKLEWGRAQAATPVEKRWPFVSASPSVSYSLPSPLQVSPPPTKAEVARYTVVGGIEGKIIHAGSIREPVIMMQRPQTLNAKQSPTSSISVSPPSTAGWYPNSGAVAAAAGGEVIKGNGGLGPVPSMSLCTNNRNTQQFYHQHQYQPFASSSADPAPAGWGGSWNSTGTAPSSSLAEPSSLGLFTGWGSAGTSSGSTSPVDWSMGGSMQQCDYASIDWSVESNHSRENGLLLGLASYVKSNRTYDGWSPAMTAGTKSPRMNGIYGGLHEGGVVPDVSAPSSSANSHEWTSPFAGQDLFSVPRQFVTSPSL